jgi:hypothetical protein
VLTGYSLLSTSRGRPVPRDQEVGGTRAEFRRGAGGTRLAARAPECGAVRLCEGARDAQRMWNPHAIAQRVPSRPPATSAVSALRRSIADASHASDGNREPRQCRRQRGRGASRVDLAERARAQVLADREGEPGSRSPGRLRGPSRFRWKVACATVARAMSGWRDAAQRPRAGRGLTSSRQRPCRRSGKGTTGAGQRWARGNQSESDSIEWPTALGRDPI